MKRRKMKLRSCKLTAHVSPEEWGANCDLQAKAGPPPVSVRKVTNTAPLIIYSCFHTVTAELSTYDKDPMACKA